MTLAIAPARPGAIDTEIRHTEALRLRAIGHTFAEIASKLGYATPQGALSAVKSALKLIREESVEVLRAVDAERLEILTGALMPKAEKGDLLAIDKLLKIMARRAALLGLDMPTKIAPTDPTGENQYGDYSKLTDDERAARITELFGRIRARRDSELAAESGAPADTPA